MQWEIYKGFYRTEDGVGQMLLSTVLEAYRKFMALFTGKSFVNP